MLHFLEAFLFSSVLHQKTQQTSRKILCNLEAKTLCAIVLTQVHA